MIAVEPSADPVIHYAFEGNLQNSGTGGDTYDGTLLDTPGVNEPPYGPGSNGQGLDLRENPDATIDGDAVSVGYVLTDSGTIVFDYAVNKFYNYQSLWTNSVDANDWEMWIYDTGVLRGRVDSDGPVSLDLNAVGGLDETYQIAFTWQRDGDSVAVELYVDGEFQGQASGGWIEPGETFFIGGGDGGNDYAAGIFDEFKIYDTALNAGELLYLFQDRGIIGDYDGNGALDVGDLDLQAAAIASGLNPAEFDLNGDGVVDFDGDRMMWLHELKKVYVGDADLNGFFDSADFVAVFVAGKYETGAAAGWAEGDWDANLLFDSGDFVAAFVDGGYEQGRFPEAVQAVPEPGSLVLLLISLLGLCGWRSQQ